MFLIGTEWSRLRWRPPFTIRLEYDIMKENIQATWNTVDVYSINKRETRVAGASMLEMRTETPISLSEGLNLCRRLEDEGHVVELRRVT